MYKSSFDLENYVRSDIVRIKPNNQLIQNSVSLGYEWISKFINPCPKLKLCVC